MNCNAKYLYIAPIFLFFSFIQLLPAAEPDQNKLKSETETRLPASSENRRKVPGARFRKVVTQAVAQQAEHDSTELQDVNIYQSIFDDSSDDLMENHPADDIYHHIWTRERVNPYAIPIDSMPDSVRIFCKDFVAPVHSGIITSHFGPRRYRYHFGTDLRLKVGDSIRCSFDGKVRIIDYERRGYGYYVVVRHNNGLETVYAHLSKTLVEHNQTLKAGQVLGLGGNTGRSTGPHLHYEIRYLGNAINPAHMVDFAQNKMHEDSYLITRNATFYYNNHLKELRSAKYYTVRRGDTLGRIAQRNGTSINRICRLNKISRKKTIRPGQRLRVR